MVLKSTKGIYMQLESGKIIAIRSTAKPGQGSTSGLPDAAQNSSAAAGVEQALQNIGNANKNQSNSKIDSDDDECVMTSITYPTHKAPPPPNRSLAPFNLPSTSATTNDIPPPPQQVPTVQEQLREKPVFKPNLVQRKPRPAVTPEHPTTFGSQSHSSTANGGSQYNYNQHYTNYDTHQRTPSLSHNPATTSNATFSHANAQNFSNYQRKCFFFIHFLYLNRFLHTFLIQNRL